MKTKLLVIAGLLLLACAAMIAPVNAALTANTNITGNPASYGAITINLSAMNMELPASGPVHNTTPILTVTANAPFTIVATDAMSHSKDSNMGYMANSTGTIYLTSASGLDKALGSAMILTGTANATSGVETGTGDLTDPSPAALYTGTQAVDGTALALDFSQTVAATDERLVSPNEYSIDITFALTVP